ncbi:unnamed protein product [Didymodactylos carnosus]|uniref:Uncharacterized protein n=1 Tax=Didymodactylos carnosus TaxID=1234261 RepID=A0A815KLL9_9BILA|nr:unnamed protein product [Didymodactylos carnosus]CAF1394757.1 unnamed protein product [Didymodactylos carnosus]CAF4056255.1 unnamed protein product [Didymodactylos carnosus]CAF4289020.1 unnamed protein product [Didymodactylos carnosus]
MSKNGPVTSIGHSNSYRFRILEPIKVTDDFPDWEHDDWQGLLNVELEPYGSNIRFPTKWHLADNVSIHCRITNSDPEKVLSPPSPIDRLQSEIKLKICIERYRTNENGINGRSDANCSKNEKTKQMRRHTSAGLLLENYSTHNKICFYIEEQSSTFNSELYAKIHLIKLCVLYELKDPRAVQLRSILTSTEPKCLDAAFEEMQAEGFADDNLFERIKEFFFTLTISDQDLNSQWSLSGHIQQAWSARHDRLRENLNELQSDFQSKTNTYQKCMDKIQQYRKILKMKRLITKIY